jgi:hypothetical protein
MRCLRENHTRQHNASNISRIGDEMTFRGLRLAQPKVLWLCWCTAILLAGCATPQAPVQVVADSFCQAAKKKTWSVNDTPDTIEQIVKANAGIDRACGVKPTS